MANHGTATLLLMASLLMAVALSGADARLTLAAAALRDANNVVRHTGSVDEVKAAPPVPKLTCNKVQEVQVGDTCFSLGQGAGLTQEQFLSFNPNINCEKIFIGQWICFDATSA